MLPFATKIGYMKPRIWPLLISFLGGSVLFVGNVLINLEIGFAWAFLLTALGGAILGYWRHAVLPHWGMGHWLLINFWFFVYLIQAFSIEPLIGWFVLAAYGGTGLGMIAAKKRVPIWAKGLIAVCWLGLSLYVALSILPQTPPQEWNSAE